ncbi:MAG: SAM-dependent methyltransferase [Rhabdochlamydiaceae bacterium]|nr:SAM-dependent methyltransferase [Candidatus Amphrikana amoebophyrae]
MMKRCYLAPKGFEKDLINELDDPSAIQYDRLFVSENEREIVWAQNTWLEPKLVRFESISDAAKILKAILRNWALFPYKAIRRAKLIQEKLPFISQKPLPFPTPLPKAPLGSWTLLSDHELLFSPSCSSPYPNGEPIFIEDKETPPSRAYLKLIEAFTLIGNHPKKGDKCLEIGAAPGSWTYVLANLGADVIACDRSELAPHIMSRKNVEFIKGDAFALTPDKVGKVDWIVSDIICYPDKLFEWIQLWLKSDLCQNFVITIKLQGASDMDAVKKFAAIKGSKVRHLFNNKHELTWTLQIAKS